MDLSDVVIVNLLFVLFMFSFRARIVKGFRFVGAYAQIEVGINVRIRISFAKRRPQVKVATSKRTVRGEKEKGPA
ncbi:hypothetical protein ASD74_17315 [Rhizobium sp. Root564]|nr:hypothetical protein ASD74_17315 [Rhizobium sp. Root564]